MTAPPEREFRYVEEFVRYQLSQSLGGMRGMLESAVPFVGFTVAWVASRQLYLALGVAVGAALIMAVVRLAQRQSLKYVAQAVIPTAIAALVATRTGRAEDIFLPGILYNGALALLSLFTVAIRRPLVGFIIGAAVGDPTGWAKDRGLVRMTTKLTLVLAVPYITRFVIQLPLFLAGQVVWLAVAKVALGWPLLVAALTVIGVMLSKGRTPMEGSGLTRDPPRTLSPPDAPVRFGARFPVLPCPPVPQMFLGTSQRIHAYVEMQRPNGPQQIARTLPCDLARAAGHGDVAPCYDFTSRLRVYRSGSRQSIRPAPQKASSHLPFS